MQVQVVGPADLPAATRWQAVSFLRLQWPEVFSGASRRAHQTCPPAARPVHFVVTDAQTLVSYAVVMRLRASAQQEQLEVAGFGSLFTFPQYRGEGWARAVVATASAWIAGSGVDLGMLFCDPGLVPLYADSGWQRAAVGARTGTPSSPTDASGVTMLLPVSRRAHSLVHRSPPAALRVPCAW